MAVAEAMEQTPKFLCKRAHAQAFLRSFSGDSEASTRTGSKHSHDQSSLPSPSSKSELSNTEVVLLSPCIRPVAATEVQKEKALLGNWMYKSATMTKKQYHNAPTEAGISPSWSSLSSAMRGILAFGF